MDEEIFTRRRHLNVEHPCYSGVEDSITYFDAINLVSITMSTLTLFARNIARQSLGKAVRLNAGARFSAVRFNSSYFTPGE